MARADAGFTLMELLVASAVVAALALLLGQAMRGGTQFWSTASRRTETMEEATAALRFIQERLVVAYPATDKEISAEGRGFKGGATRLDWLTDLPAGWPDAGGYQRARLDVQQTIKGHELIFAWSPWQAEQLPSQQLSLGLVTGFRLDYWGRIDPSRPADWQEQWGGRPDLPELVRLEIQRPGGERQVMYVSPRIAAHAGCRLDSYSNRCQES